MKLKSNGLILKNTESIILNPKTQKLKQLYSSHWGIISNLVTEIEGLSKPLLISVPDGYDMQTTNLLVFGQQTNGWGSEVDNCDIEKLLQLYEGFSFGKKEKSAFWSFIRKIERTFEIERYKITWNNLNKCSGRGGKRPKDIEKRIFEDFPVIPEEVKIICPSLVLFLTGTDFDEHLRRTFQDVEFIPIDDIKIEDLCRVSSKILPYHSYRTYHPQFLRMSRREARVIDALGRIRVSDSRDSTV